VVTTMLFPLSSAKSHHEGTKVTKVTK